MGSPTLTAHYVPARIVPGLLSSLALAAVGVVTALAGVTIGWILTAIMLWSVANAVNRLRRRTPVVTLDAAGVTDHRVPLHIAWDDVESMRTVNRRVVVVKNPLLELVPREPLARDRSALIGAVVRGDMAFADARDDHRVMIDLKHLDTTPEELLAAARELRATVHGHGKA